MQRRTVTKRQSEPSNKKRTMILVIFVLLLLVATGAWAMWRREDPQVALVRNMMSEMESIPEEQRREHFGKIREEMEKLPEEQRDLIRDEQRAHWEQREMERMKKFFELPAEQQTAELDRMIDRMEKWRQERERNGRNRGPGGDRGGRGGRNRGAQSFGVGANGSVGASERDLSRINRGSPEGRAYRDQFRRMLAQRMQQRGIEGFRGRGPR